MDAAEIFRIILTGLVTALISSIPSLFLFKKYSAESRKTTSESNQIDSEIINEEKRVLLEAKRAEVEVAERLIKSAGDLIENYQGMIETFERKFVQQEERHTALATSLQTEIKKREKLERTLRDFIVGIRRLLNQLRENKLTPVWEPKIDIDAMEE